MRIATPTLASDPLQFAEWLELLALIRTTKTSGEGDLRGLLSGCESDDDALETDDVIDDELEQNVNEVFIELDTRQRWGGRGYPFRVEAGGSSVLRWKRDTLSAEQLCYAFCLLVSALKELDSTSRDLFPRLGELEDLFQACGTLAGAGAINGNSVSFGFPRPDIPSFYKKLAEVAELLGEGDPRSGFHPGASVNPGDAGVDVIAWRSSADSLPGQSYLLGQCGSGLDWVNKRPLEEYAHFHSLYWHRAPSSPVLGTTFVPFDFRSGITAINYDTKNDAQKWARWNKTTRFGVIVDRFRLARHFSKGVWLSQRAGLRLWIEGAEKLPDMRSWIADCSAFLMEV